jgi:anthranilate phosphoribosyltransferase
MSENCKELDVNNLLAMLGEFLDEKKITGKTKVVLSSDEEGNEYSSLIKVGDMYNVSCDGGRLVLYPSSGHRLDI